MTESCGTTRRCILEDGTLQRKFLFIIIIISAMYSVCWKVERGVRNACLISFACDRQFYAVHKRASNWKSGGSNIIVTSCVCTFVNPFFFVTKMVDGI
jgi:hypothetical protein